MYKNKMRNENLSGLMRSKYKILGMNLSNYATLQYYTLRHIDKSISVPEFLDLIRLLRKNNRWQMR
ncbi:hypothetical protein HI914_02839 [Erysiphe necator]|nr:hypothetical protein HI914_02839 [Erysiphe necator]